MKTEHFLNSELQNIKSLIKKQLNEKNDDPIFFIFTEINLTTLLNSIICENFFFFKSKQEDFKFLGLGRSKTIKAQQLKNYIEKNSTHFLIATFLFETDPNASEFILPEWMFVSRNGKTELTLFPSFEYKIFSSPSLFFDLNQKSYGHSSWQCYEEFPDRDQWAEIINKSDLLFDNDELKKIVLSRKKIFNYHQPIMPIDFFLEVMEKNNNANFSYAIFHQMAFDKAFISLTPEKLFSLSDNKFESISLAASAPRGATPEEDQIFEKLLNTNDKLIREHNLVTEEILKKIEPYSNNTMASELQTMKLPYIQHRSVSIHAELSSDISALELVKLLHPTPAVGGLPSDKAQIKILELEPYERKSYAAPIGLMSKHYSEIAVGIRSALIEGSKITVFGGAGIVKGSIAEEEWIETGIKMNPFIKVINHE